MSSVLWRLCVTSWKQRFTTVDSVAMLGLSWPTLMGTRKLNENGPNPFFIVGTKNMIRVNLMATVFKENLNASKPSDQSKVRSEHWL